ncbi:RNA polymerase sigma factor [Psychroflexus sp. MES1-P1E]|uniref:RNA polymerase sigma factor n=1 Tax=Psychroflexus sp. MES1-P1E TaxID=2058320 RepID=UPI001C60E8D9|nr:sigma-70 family RNA polymerase sigma factor [Psychroflexus sp. MES1-P1E]
MSNTIHKISEDLKTENNFVISRLHKDNFKKISKFVLNNSGSIADAEDLFQDTMFVLIGKIRQEQFQLTASIDAYLYAISKNLWLKKLRDRKRHLYSNSIQTIDLPGSGINIIGNDKTYSERLKEYLQRITAHCYGLLNDFFLKEKDIEQIQEKYGYSTRHNAINQKYKCIKQIRKLKELEEKSKKTVWLGDFLNPLE